MYFAGCKMIVRAILKNPDLADNFDYFNDFRDTLTWLYMQRRMNPSPECDVAIHRLEQGHANYLEKKSG